MEVTLEEREPEPEPATDDASLTLVQQISKKIRLEKKQQQQVPILGCLELKCIILDWSLRYSGLAVTFSTRPWRLLPERCQPRV